MPSMDGVSDIRMPLGIQKFGAKAARPAAVRPTHGPATARPSTPTHRTTRAPTRGMARLWTVAPSGFTTISMAPTSSEVRGGWAAVGAVPSGVRKNSPCWSSTAVMPYQKAS